MGMLSEPEAVGQEEVASRNGLRKFDRLRSSHLAHDPSLESRSPSTATRRQRMYS